MPEPDDRSYEAWRGLDDMFWQWLRNAIRNAGGNPDILKPKAPEPACWVLVKGYHDSGAIDHVFGPHSEAHVDWLLSTLLEYSSANWTKVKLSDGPEEAS